MLNFAEQTGSGAVMIVWSFLPRKGTIKVYEAVRARVPQKHQSDTLTQHTTANLPTQLNNKQTNKQTTRKQPQSNHKATKRIQKTTSSSLYLHRIDTLHAITIKYPFNENHNSIQSTNQSNDGII